MGIFSGINVVSRRLVHAVDVHMLYTPRTYAWVLPISFGKWSTAEHQESRGSIEGAGFALERGAA